MAERFEGKVAVITGGGHGIGRATAQRLGQEGARVAVMDIRAEAATEAVNLLTKEGIDAAAWIVDVADDSAVSSAVPEILEHFGHIDVLHANAGILLPGTALSQTVDEWEKTFAVNVRSHFLMCKAVIPSMIEQGGGAIVLTASVSGMIGEPGSCAYDASKAAVINLTRQLAVEYARQGIRVNCICPGWVETGFNDPYMIRFTDEEVTEMIDAAVPLGRQATAGDVAPCVAFLASDDARYVTGHALLVDGGLYAL